MSLKPKHQRLVLVAAAAVAVLAAVLLAMLGLKDRAAFFYTPVDIAAGKAADLCVWPIADLAELGYWIGMPGPDRRIVAGLDA